MTPERWHEIHKLRGEGMSARRIAARLGIHRNTVKEALEQLRPQPETRASRGSIIDPYCGFILAKLEQYPELTAATLFRQIGERGYAGGYTLVKECVADLRPRVRPAYFTLNFAPGECAQVDWGVWKGADVPGGRRRLSFFAMVLCHSRLMYAELFTGEAMEYWLTAHRRAFEAFGGVPAKVMVDNCKTAVLKPKGSGAPAVFNPAYLDFAAHYGFEPVACTPARPNEKGRVEHAVGYIKSGFLAGRDPAPPAAMQPALADWVDNVANVRVHGTTRRRPVDMFAEEEKEALGPLPAGPHDCAVETPAVVNSRFRIIVDTNRYSVPSQHASRRVLVRRCAERITIHEPSGGPPIADHPRSLGRHQDILDPHHERDLVLRTRHAREKHMLEPFLHLGGAAEAYLTGLREKRSNWATHVARINALAEVHGRDETARALQDSLEHHAFSAEYIHNILETRTRLRPEAGPLHVARRQDLLELKIPDADLDIYQPDPETKENNQ